MANDFLGQRLVFIPVLRRLRWSFALTERGEEGMAVSSPRDTLIRVLSHVFFVTC
jgi:hypothetical protein